MRRRFLFFFLTTASKKGVDTSDVNKRVCGSLAQTQASARVDVPTARVFPVWTKESNTHAIFVANAWICTREATDRDLETKK